MRPLVLNETMVKAVIDGRKNQFRKIIQNPENLDAKCPFGVVGDRIWVRETYAFLPSEDGLNKKGRLIYKQEFNGDMFTAVDGTKHHIKWRPAVFMKRSQSRILLEIEEIRSEQLQNISERDAVYEGLFQLPASGRYVVNQGDQYFGMADRNPVNIFSHYWDQLHGDGAWEMNPYVWVIKFRDITPLRSIEFEQVVLP